MRPLELSDFKILAKLSKSVVRQNKLSESFEEDKHQFQANNVVKILVLLVILLHKVVSFFWV